jgi:hypothetical protein
MAKSKFPSCFRIFPNYFIRNSELYSESPATGQVRTWCSWSLDTEQAKRLKWLAQYYVLIIFLQLYYEIKYLILSIWLSKQYGNFTMALGRTGATGKYNPVTKKKIFRNIVISNWMQVSALFLCVPLFVSDIVLLIFSSEYSSCIKYTLCFLRL